jgi:hypothetical protein
MQIAFLAAKSSMQGSRPEEDNFILPRRLCRGISSPGDLAFVPITRCCDPLFFGLTFRMNPPGDRAQGLSFGSYCAHFVLRLKRRGIFLDFSGYDGGLREKCNFDHF